MPTTSDFLEDATTAIFLPREVTGLAAVGIDKHPTRNVAMAHSPPVTPKLWDANDVAGFLRVSRSWVYQKSESGALPVIRMPGSSLLRFDPDAICAFARGTVSEPGARIGLGSRQTPRAHTLNKKR